MMIIKTKASKHFSDYLGIMSSGICVVHCILLPFLVLVWPLRESEPWVNLVFWLLSAWAVYRSQKHTPRRWIGSGLWFFLFLLGISFFLEHRWSYMHYVSYAAAAGLIAGHLWNIRSCKKCNRNVTSSNY